MKKVLKYLSFVLLFVFSITLAACDEDVPTPAPDNGTTNNSGENNSSNNTGGTTETQHTHNFAEGCKYEENNSKYTTQHSKYCVDCKETVWFNHEYGEWQTTIPATPFSNGLETKYCECGHKETQTVNSVESNLVSDEYTTNLLNSFSDKICLVVDNVDLQCNFEYENLEFAMTDGALYIELDEEYNVVAYCAGQMDVNFDGVTATFTAEAVYKDDYVYISALENGFDIDEEYKYPHDFTNALITSDFTYKVPAGNIYTEEIPMDEYMEEVEYILTTFADEIKYISENVNPEALGVYFNLAVKEIIDTIFVNNSDEGYCYSLNYEGLAELNAKLDTTTISQLYNERFGEGAYDELSEVVSNVFDLTFADLNKYIKDNNIDIKSVLDYADKLIKLSDEEASLKGIFENLTDEEIKDLITYFSQTPMKDIKVISFISNNEDINEYKETILAQIAGFGNMTTYDVIALIMDDGTEVETLSDADEPEYSEYKIMIDSFIELFNSIDNCCFYTTADGYITAIDLAIDVNALEFIGLGGTVEATIEFDFEAGYDVDDVIEKVDALISKIDINENTTIIKDSVYDIPEYVYYDDEFTFDANGNLTGYNRVTERIHGEHISTNTTITHDVYVTREEYSIDLTNAPIYISSACDRYEVEFLNNGKYVSTVRLYEDVTVDLETYNLHVEANDLDSYFYGLISNLNFTQEESYSHETNSIRVYYDSEANTADFNSYGTDEIHNFVKDEEKSVVGDSCCALNVDYYICSDCGAHSVEYWGHDHTGTITATYSETTDCWNEGCVVTYYCSDCQVTWKETEYGHNNTMQPIELFEGLTCSKEHSMTGQVCACGQEFDPEYGNADTTMTVLEQTGTYCKYYCSDCGVYLVCNVYFDKITYDIYLTDPATSDVYRSFTVYTY